MLNEMKVEVIEAKLNHLADVYYTASNPEIKGLNKGYCQGIAFVLGQIGYSIEWDNGKAIIVKEDRQL